VQAYLFAARLSHVLTTADVMLSVILLLCICIHVCAVCNSELGDRRILSACIGYLICGSCWFCVKVCALLQIYALVYKIIILNMQYNLNCIENAVES